jgi:predicted flap endonuclease-1-like 5' DNA nuclease
MSSDNTADTNPDTISHETFTALLSRYPALLASISASRGNDLADLDEFRYTTAPALVRCRPHDNRGEPMTLAHLCRLVEWKLRHGKFRPTLLALVSSNPPDVVSATISEAITATTQQKQQQSSPSSSPSPSSSSPPKEALATLCKLKGIGPATASLVLSVHDPARAPFFSDENFWWLCCGGKKAQIRYNAQEYMMLHARVAEVVARLGVEAVDVEKVAFVVMREGGHSASKLAVGKVGSVKEEANGGHKNDGTSPTGEHAASSSQKATDVEPAHGPSMTVSKPSTKRTAAKAKVEEKADDGSQPAPRRSKRLKTAI